MVGSVESSIRAISARCQLRKYEVFGVVLGSWGAGQGISSFIGHLNEENPIFPNGFFLSFFQRGEKALFSTVMRALRSHNALVVVHMRSESSPVMCLGGNL